MDLQNVAQYANIVSAAIAVVAFIPTVISYYRNWPVWIRRVLSVLCCLFLGIAVGGSLAARAVPPRDGVTKNATVAGSTENDLQNGLRVANDTLQRERGSREAAEKKWQKENADRVEAERQARDDRIARETAEKRAEKETASRAEVERQAKDERVARMAAEEKARELASDLSNEARNRGAAEVRATGLSNQLQDEKARTAELEQQLRDAREKIRNSFPPPPPARDGFIRAYFYDEPRGWNRIDWAALQRMRRERINRP
jgi:hypothetical protein